jgi:hypothetical protein
MLTVPNQPTKPYLTRLEKKRMEERRIEEQRMKDVALLLDYMFEREEITVKRILDCLYDVGSVNLINQRVQVNLLNQLMKAIARMTRPVFRIVAYRWFRKNCPQLIADWLRTKVSF